MGTIAIAPLYQCIGNANWATHRLGRSNCSSVVPPGVDSILQLGRIERGACAGHESHSACRQRCLCCMPALIRYVCVSNSYAGQRRLHALPTNGRYSTDLLHPRQHAKHFYQAFVMCSTTSDAGQTCFAPAAGSARILTASPAGLLRGNSGQGEFQAAGGMAGLHFPSVTRLADASNAPSATSCSMAAGSSPAAANSAAASAAAAAAPAAGAGGAPASSAYAAARTLPTASCSATLLTKQLLPSSKCIALCIKCIALCINLINKAYQPEAQ